MNKQGQSLIEILVSLGVFALVASSVFSLFFGGQKFSLDGATGEVANEYALEGIDAVRSVGDRSWSELATGTKGLVFLSGEWYFASTSSDTKSIFTRTVTITDIDENTKRASTTITWSADTARPQTVEVAEIITNWKKPLSGGCSSDPLSGDWTNPRIASNTPDLGSSIVGTDVVVDYPYAYVSGTSGTATKHDVFVYNVSLPNSPNLLTSLDIGSGGIEDLYLAGKYLYAASPNDSKELIIFDISNPGSMSEVGSYNLSGTGNGFAVFTFPQASTTAVGRVQNTGAELAFINVMSPSTPTLIREDETGGDIEDFYINDDTLYFVSQQSDPDIWWYDVTDGANPILAGNYDIPGTTEDISIWLQNKNGESNLLVGNENNNELRTVGTVSSTTGGMWLRDIVAIGGDVRDISCVKGDLAFLATSNTSKDLFIVDANNPDYLFEKGSVNLPAIGVGVDYATNTVYVAISDRYALKIILPGL